jgi:hypothetical protein
MQELQAEQRRETQSYLRACKLQSKTRTAQQSQPDAPNPNPNTPESMVENAHRTLIQWFEIHLVPFSTFSVVTP